MSRSFFVALQIDHAVGVDERRAAEVIGLGVLGEFRAHDRRDLRDVDLRDDVVQLDRAVLEVVDDAAVPLALGRDARRG